MLLTFYVKFTTAVAVVCVILACLSALAPNSFLLRWATLKEKRGAHGAAFFMCLGVTIFFSAVTAACGLIWQAVAPLVICAFGTLLMWARLRYGDTPKR